MIDPDFERWRRSFIELKDFTFEPVAELWYSGRSFIELKEES